MLRRNLQQIFHRPSHALQHPRCIWLVKQLRLPLFTWWCPCSAVTSSWAGWKAWLTGTGLACPKWHSATYLFMGEELLLNTSQLQRECKDVCYLTKTELLPRSYRTTGRVLTFKQR